MLQQVLYDNEAHTGDKTNQNMQPHIYHTSLINSKAYETEHMFMTTIQKRF